ncbi:hypothetical protein QR680_008560 [Steinernema hermaphroditum]|uniref:Uncharacterized protein n=1 Tax=Steinernema hermaphroditum TaxID=289476 RepID=A0AA39M785_9BILA|nr:hypothetical protein QR680_008560 [Steinernema hermaphroditum]
MKKVFMNQEAVSRLILQGIIIHCCTSFLRSLGDRRKKRSFFNRFLGVSFDLSEVLFIVSQIEEFPGTVKRPHFSPSCPRDELTTEKCIEIMKRQLIPKVLPEYNRESSPLSDSHLKVIIDDFTQHRTDGKR